MAPTAARRPVQSACLAVLLAASLLRCSLPEDLFAAPQQTHGSSASPDTFGGSLKRDGSAVKGQLGVTPGQKTSGLPRASFASTLAHTAVPFSIAAGMAAGLRNLLRPKHVSAEATRWDARRTWTALNVVNHGIYAALFIIRSFFYTGVGGNDRPFYFESYFLGWLCGPSVMLPTWLGWDNNMYNQPAVLAWVTKMNSASSGAFPAWIANCVGSPAFMYLYQIAEGTFHCMIVAGGLRAFFNRTWPPKKDSAMALYRWGLWLELIVMDIAYVTAYSYLPFLSVPGHWGLTTIMMIIHHLNVLPDIASAWYEWKASKAAEPTEGSKLQPAMA